jgi:hypothetical protein
MPPFTFEQRSMLGLPDAETTLEPSVKPKPKPDDVIAKQLTLVVSPSSS